MQINEAQVPQHRHQPRQRDHEERRRPNPAPIAARILSAAQVNQHGNPQHQQRVPARHARQQCFLAYIDGVADIRNADEARRQEKHPREAEQKVGLQPSPAGGQPRQEIASFDPVMRAGTEKHGRNRELNRQKPRDHRRRHDEAKRQRPTSSRRLDRCERTVCRVRWWTWAECNTGKPAEQWITW